MSLLGVDTENVRTRMDLVDFIYLLLANLRGDPRSWENQTLETFLEAVAGWIKDVDGAYQNMGIEFSEDKPWNFFAQMLLGGATYE